MSRFAVAFVVLSLIAAYGWLALRRNGWALGPCGGLISCGLTREPLTRLGELALHIGQLSTSHARSAART